MKISWLIYLGTAALLAATGCAVPGAPLPPSLNLPKPVHDLHAVRKGATANLSWSTPDETTDGDFIRKPGKMIVNRRLQSNQNDRADTTFRAIDQPLPPPLKDGPTRPATFTDDLSSLLHSNSPAFSSPASGSPADFAVYSVEAANGSGKSAGKSNQVLIPLVPTLPAPAALQVSAVPQGISISWQAESLPQNATHFSVEYAYKITRRQEGAKQATQLQQISANNENFQYIDTTIEWQKHYQYWVTPVTLWQQASGKESKGQVEGDDSPIVSVYADDVFPPAVPSGLQAVFSGIAEEPFVDLTWTANSEADLDGYQVYRHTEGAPPARITTAPVKPPAFRDTKTEKGKKYFYSVSAVDQRGNESGKSTEASESIPKD
ncbi:MAG TPA: hypothetical protein VKZ53_14410 [Candidatus Angelobacter sp.]|nr:hypothetical protein [Candidatus Angelobacter sp.]